MSTQVLTAAEIISTIQISIDFHTGEVEKLKAMLLAVSGKPYLNGPSNRGHIIPEAETQSTVNYNINIKQKQLNEIVAIMKSLDRPLLKSELLDQFNLGKKKQLKKATIGALLSDAVKKGVMKNMIYNDLPNGKRNWWVLPTWLVVDGSLDNKYYSKINT